MTAIGRTVEAAIEMKNAALQTKVQLLLSAKAGQLASLPLTNLRVVEVKSQEADAQDPQKLIVVARGRDLMI
jgi:hypothetical protein